MTYLPTLWQAERAANRLTVADSLWMGRVTCRTRGGAVACRSCAIDDAANTSDDSETAPDRGGARQAYRPGGGFRLSDDSVDLMKAFSLGGSEGIGGAWKIPPTEG